MRGFQFIVDESGRKKAVIIDLETHSKLWEDFEDQAVARARKKEPRESMETVRQRLAALGKLPKNA